MVYVVFVASKAIAVLLVDPPILVEPAPMFLEATSIIFDRHIWSTVVVPLGWPVVVVTTNLYVTSIKILLKL